MRGIYCVMGIVILSAVGGVALAASPLDETQWRLEITAKGAEIPKYIDRARFHKGIFTSAIFERKGFLTSRYTVTKKEGGSIVWEVTQTSEAEGTLSWRGELKGDAMTGTLRWTQTDRTVVNHTFTGKPPAPKPKPEAVIPPSKETPPPSP